MDTGPTETLTGAPVPRPGPAQGTAHRSVGRVLFGRLRESLSDPGQVLPLVLIGAFVARAAWLAIPDSSIFDEAFYVNAARVILGWDVPDTTHYGMSPPGLDPNVEHPALGKVLMATSMAVFGDNGLGWRLPSVIAGMIALVALYAIVRAAGESRWLGILAVALFGFDNLVLVHSRIGTLDMMVLAPILVGAWLALQGRWFAAGALVGVGTLVKLTGIYGLGALLLWLAVRQLGQWRKRRWLDLEVVRRTGLVLAGFGLVFGVGLWALDARFTTFTSPIDHVSHMIQYGGALTRPGEVGHCTGNDSAPWQWLVNDCEMTYYRVDVTTRAGEQVVASHASIDFRGAMNPVLLGLVWLAFPAAAWLAWRRRSTLALWSLGWAAANYLPFLALAILQSRITYIYYFLPVIPALAVAVALLLLRSGLPRFVLWPYLAAYVVGVIAYFPFRQLP
jgi:dolichyl-phosphate-mannose-protein mannosyltransferase